jgi:hypothetical protein
MTVAAAASNLMRLAGVAAVEASGLTEQEEMSTARQADVRNDFGDFRSEKARKAKKLAKKRRLVKYGELLIERRGALVYANTTVHRSTFHSVKSSSAGCRQKHLLSVRIVLVQAGGDCPSSSPCIWE